MSFVIINYNDNNIWYDVDGTKCLNAKNSKPIILKYFHKVFFYLQVANEINNIPTNKN